MCNSQNAPITMEDILGKKKKMELRKANRLLNTDDESLKKLFQRSTLFGEQKKFESFAEFLIRVKQTLREGNIDDFRDLLELRASIRRGNHLTQAQIELAEKYDLKHWKWADIEGRTLTEIFDSDMRNTIFREVNVKGDIKNSVISAIEGSRIGCITNSIVEAIYESTTGAIYESTTGGIFNSTISGEYIKQHPGGKYNS